jgi:hypothetical protein
MSNGLQYVVCTGWTALHAAAATAAINTSNFFMAGLVCEAQLGESLLHILILHEILPKKAGTVVFYHHHNRTLVNRDV